MGAGQSGPTSSRQLRQRKAGEQSPVLPILQPLPGQEYKRNASRRDTALDLRIRPASQSSWAENGVYPARGALTSVNAPQA